MLALSLVTLIAAALVPGPHRAGTQRFAVAKLARLHAAAEPARPHPTATPAGAGPDVRRPAPEHGTAAPSAATEAISRYRSYSERWSGRLAAEVALVRSDLAAGGRAAARRAWQRAFADYLHLGAVPWLLPAAIARRLGGMPSERGDGGFAGLHRLGVGLWTNAAPRSLGPAAVALAQAVGQERRILPRLRIAPTGLASGVRRILAAQMEALAGAQAPWRGAGVLGTAASLAAARETIATLVPLLPGLDRALGQAQSWLATLQLALDGVRLRDGDWPAVAQLSPFQRARLDQTLNGALSALRNAPASRLARDAGRAGAGCCAPEL